MQYEAVQSLVQSMSERIELHDPDEPSLEVYYRVAAGEKVRSAQSIASGLAHEGSHSAIADRLRGVISRNLGHSIYVIHACARGEKSPLDSVTVYGDPDHQEPMGMEQGAVGALAAALVQSSRSADERAMSIAHRNAELADRLLDSAQHVAELRAELRAMEMFSELDSGSTYGRALEAFATAAGPAVAKLLADRMPAPQAPPRTVPDDGSPFAVVAGLVDELVATLDAHPNVLGFESLSDDAAALLQRLQAATLANLAQPSEPIPVEVEVSD